MEEDAPKPMEARPYQLELADYVTKRNGIIYLPTGAGKTFVSILVLKRLAHTLNESVENGGKRAIFMCNTVELSRQQARELKKSTCLKIGLYIGDRDVDNWARRKWEEEIAGNQVLVGTAQIFVDIIAQNLLKITDLSLVVIDECHHATGNHPMHAFLSLFQLVDQSKVPRVVGLTGVLIKGNKLGNVEEDLRKLESTLRGNIVTVRSTEQMQNVMVYSTKPYEELVAFTDKSHTFNIELKIKRLIEECKQVVDNWDIGTILKMSKNLTQQREPNKKNYIKTLLNDFVYQMNEFGLYAGAIAIMSPIIDFEIKKRQAETMSLRNLYRIVIQHCERIRHILVKELKSFIDPDEDAAGNEVLTKVKDKDIQRPDVILNYATPKLRSLLKHMETRFKGKAKDDIACLVFVQRRYTAKCLYFVIMHYVALSPALKDIIRPQFMVGRENIIASIESILDSKWNKNAIDQFRSKECNLIVCSNVLEEGIDVQACNYVFALDPLTTFNAYIQTKGRARSQESCYSIFTPKLEEGKTVEQIRKYNFIHEKIKNFLMTRILERDDPNEEEIAEQFVDLIPPYVIRSGAKLLATSALQLLHRYCQSLPWDAFGACQPWFSMLPPTDKRKVAVSIQLPLQSTVRETIVSDYMSSNKEAKISAAFKACIRLYENGELNDLLLPVTKSECVAKVEESLFKHWKKHDDNVCKKLAGKQLPRLYDRKCPEELYNAMPCLGEASYAYAIEFATDFANVNPYNEHIVQYLNSKATYAILLNRKLPNLAEMPLFMSQGKLRVNISKHPIQCVVRSEQELLLLKHFHAMIFKDILDVWKEFIVMDHRNKENSYLIVPINEQRCLDWYMVRQFQKLNPMRQPTLAERRNVVYHPQEYLGKVITKWYNEVECERFVVTRIRDDLRPTSRFDSKNYSTYADFFASRYNVEVLNKTQFLLEVKPLTQRRNFFNNASNKTAEKRKETNLIILIPELCHNYQYPGEMWLKALFLPSILHRVYYALHAEMLRNRINKFLGLDRYFKNYTPRPLIIDTSLRRVLDDDGNIIKNKDLSAKLLPPLPTKEHTEDYHVRSLNSNDLPWKSFMQPLDFSRNLDTTFPVDLQYFVRFVNNNKDVINDSNEEWSKSQLDVCQPQDYQTAQNDIMLSSQMKPLSIKDSSFNDKTYIEILKRSVEPEQNLKSAEQYEFLAALTTAGVNDVFDMERYELLGDAFLKFSVSLYLANKYTKWNEGFLTIVKGRLVSNKNLLYCLMETDICKRICSTPFKPNALWLPPLCSLPGNLLELLLNNLPAANTLSPIDFYDLQLTENEIHSGQCMPDKLSPFIQKCNQSKELNAGAVNLHLDNDMNLYLYKEVIRDKVVADTLEAILGVCVKNYGIHRSFRMLEFFNICPTEAENPLTNLLDLKLSSAQLRTGISTKDVNAFLPNVHLLERNIGYTFRDHAFLLQALTHPSYPTNRLTGCYQELEFIGDAILDMLITCYIFERYEHMDPGKITDLRSALVNNVTLGCICVRRRIHLFMLYENATLAESIRTFADFQDTQDHLVTDQVRILMEESSLEMGKSFKSERCIAGGDDDNDDDDGDDGNAMSAEDDSEVPAATWPRGNKKNISFNMATKIDVPKALGDVVEAIIGAIYLDCRDLTKTWQVVYKLFEHELNEFSRNVPIDPVRQLGEVKHANPKYSTPMVDNEICMVKCMFNCLDKSYTTNGFGSNTIQAKKAAAKQALQIIAKHSN